MILRALVPCFVVAAIAACSVVPRPSSAPRAVYVLEVPLAAGAGAPSGAGVVAIAPPSASPGYRSSAMIYQRGENQLEPFAYHAWAEPPAAMLAPGLVVALEATGAYAAVTRDPARSHSDWRLDTEVTRFRQEFPDGGPSRVRVAVRAQIVETATSRVLDARTIEVEEAAEAATPEAGVAAMQRAWLRILSDIASYCVEATEDSAR